MTRAIITGVTGCLGSNLAAALVRQGVDVIGIVQPGAPRTAIQGLPLTLREADILDAKALQDALEPADWLFHTAAIADDWKHSAVAVYRTNVEGTENVLAAARRVGVRRFLLTASAAALGVPTRLNPLLDENSRFNLPPQDWTYAIFKSYGRKSAVARGRGKRYGMRQPAADCHHRAGRPEPDLRPAGRPRLAG